MLWTGLLTDICLACRQALLGHGDTVYLFATENNFHHSDDTGFNKGGGK